MPNERVTILIVTHNSAGTIEECLLSLGRSGIRTLLIDNASADDTVRRAGRAMPEVEIVASGGNLGYARANNLGLRATTTEFALVMNPDVRMTSEVIEKLVDVMDRYADVALVGPWAVEEGEQDEEHTRRRLETLDNITRSPGQNTYYGKDGDCVFTRFITGAVFLARMQSVREIGFFDESFFMYEEDTDLCRRIDLAGLRIACLPKTTVLHIGNRSSSDSPRYAYRRAWHLDGWSILNMKHKRKGALRARKTALRLVLKYLFLAIGCLLLFRKRPALRYLAAMSGSFAFLIGQKAFKPSGEPRG